MPCLILIRHNYRTNECLDKGSHVPQRERKFTHLIQRFERLGTTCSHSQIIFLNLQNYNKLDAPTKNPHKYSYSQSFYKGQYFFVGNIDILEWKVRLYADSITKLISSCLPLKQYYKIETKRLLRMCACGGRERGRRGSREIRSEEGREKEECLHL